MTLAMPCGKTISRSARHGRHSRRAGALASGALARVLGEYAAKPSGIYAVYPINRLMTPKIRLFVDYLAQDLRARGLSN